MKITLPTPYPAQVPILKAAIDPTIKYCVINGGRQVGKTVMLIITALYWALSENNQHIMIVSPTDGMVKKIYNQMVGIIGKHYKSIVSSSKSSAGDSQIVFKQTNSLILFRSSAAEDSLRGYSNTHLLLDEAAFQKEETWNTILAPTLAVRGKKALFCSTPKGNNFFCKIYSKGVNQEEGYKSFKITYKDNPYANLQFIQDQKDSLPTEIFEQEYLGEFIDSSSIFKNVDEQAFLVKSLNTNQECVIGIDIAFQKDYTVAVCLNQHGHMLDYIRFNKVETPEVVENLKQFINKWKPKKTLIENNNQGLPIYHMLKQSGIMNLQEFNTNPGTKTDIINQLMAAFGKKEIAILNDETVKNEFKAFTYSISNTGKISFSAAYGHDDIVMATAIAWEAKKKIAVYNLVIRK